MKQYEGHKVKASACISRYFLDAWGIDADAMLETATVSPKTLLNVDRFDLACKLYYIDCKATRTDTTFAKELYQTHIEAFSDGVFIEPGMKTKNSIQDYFAAFDQLITDIRTNGFDPAKSFVPVGEDGVILDGSHRVAIAIYYSISLTIVKIPGKTCKYNYEFFRGKGLREDYLDFMAYQFIRFSDLVYCACLWPVAYDSKKLAEVDRMIRSSADIVYHKKVRLNYHGVEQLMITFYNNMSWTGSIEDGYRGIAAKAKECYRNNAPMTLYVISGVSLNQVLRIKQRIRDLYAIDNSSVHITDTHDEAVETGKMLLNLNSIDFMNYGEPYRNSDFVKTFVHRAKAELPFTSIEDTLGLYAIRECSPYDDYGGVELLNRPKDYFYFWGVRVPSLDYVKAAKKERKSALDLEDLCLIEAFERKKHSKFAVGKENIIQVIRKISLYVSRTFENLRKELSRAVKVLFHRIKYNRKKDNKGRNIGTGNSNITDLQTIFLSINTTTADYLIIRNWEGFFDDILLEGHNDIDLLCRDKDSRDIIVRLLDARSLTNDGFHYCFQYRGQEVTLDTRILGDGYYDRRWQRDMLRHKRLHPQGYYVMDSENYYYSLIYHAIYQKENGLSDEYAQRLNCMASAEKHYMQHEFADQLSVFMNDHRYVYTETADRSVIKNFGITKNPKIIRYPWNIRLYHCVTFVKNKHYLQKLKRRIRNIILRG